MMRKYMNLLIILFIALLGGAAGVFFKIAIEEIPPDLFTFLRFVVAYLAFIPFFIREKISFSKWFGVILGFAGLVAILLAPGIGADSVWDGSILGNTMIGLAVVSFSLYAVLSKK